MIDSIVSLLPRRYVFFGIMEAWNVVFRWLFQGAILKSANCMALGRVCSQKFRIGVVIVLVFS